MNDLPELFAFELQDVSYHYRVGELSLQGINLKIRVGERVVLLGPNGGGKSTLQKIVAGLIFGEGKFSAYGRAITAEAMRDKDFAAAYRRKVGFVFQNSDVQLFCATVLDEIMFGPLAMGMHYAEAMQRAQELLDFVGISALAERMPQHLSGGEKKKVAIAAVLAVNPDALILDEPTNGLDPKTQRWMITTLNALHRSGKTLLVATHNLDLVPEIADRVIVLGENHQIMADGSPDRILNDRALLLEANLIDEYCSC